VVRVGLRETFKGSDVEVCGEASTAVDALRLVEETKPDVVLLDIRMEGGDGLNDLGRIKLDHPELPILLFSAYDNPTYVARSAALGAVDYVLKGSPRKDLITAIERAYAGEKPAPESIMNRVRSSMARQTERNDDIPLTNRELQVLRHVALGLSNREIGQSLGISIETVKEHVQNILRKLDVNDRTQAAVWAVRKGLV
jgi:DNA-binding NarL/FixJ family response regulator